MKRYLFLAVLLAIPAFAQTDMSGAWQPFRQEDLPERGQGPDLGDYTGYPVTDGARLFADSWDASRLTLQEHQCRVHTVTYIYRGPLAVRISEVRDPETQAVVALRHVISTYEQERMIWMDGRAHPPAWAPHTWMGFSTGEWHGRVLTVKTTHIKQNWIRRNGLPQSDKAEMVEHFVRHGDILTHATIITDPVYLTEPLIRTQEFRLADANNITWLWPCEYVTEVSLRDRNAVPHHLPGTNEFLKEYRGMYNFPEAAKGGAETTYPEYMKTINKVPAPAPAAVPIATTRTSPPNGDLQTIRVAENLYSIQGAGGNVTVQVGEQGLVVVDSGLAANAPKLIAEIKKLSTKRIRYLINTHVHPDHIGGNEALAGEYGSVAKVNVAGTPGAQAVSTVKIIAHENIMSKMATPPAQGQPSPFPSTAWPTDTYFTGQREFYFNGESVVVVHQPAAHTDGDSIVYFRKADVIATGDLFNIDSYPFADSANGGTVQGIIEALGHVMDLAIPKHHQEGGTMIVPGHGRICDEHEVLEYRDMIVIIRDRVKNAIAKGLTFDQIKGAKLTLDYDARYGSPDRFLDAIYKNLTAKK
jgi:cyclase